MTKEIAAVTLEPLLPPGHRDVLYGSAWGIRTPDLRLERAVS